MLDEGDGLEGCALSVYVGSMGAVHGLIERQGKHATLLIEVDRGSVEAAAWYLADEDAGIGFLYSGWCQAALPHPRPSDAKRWQIISDHVTLIVEPGVRPGPIELEPAGVPYGLEPA
jgi:hypothetical protein